MDGKGGTIKKLVPRAERALINSVKEPCEVANCVTSIASLHQSKNNITKELNETKRSPATPNTLSIQKIVKKQNEDSQTTLEFFKLSIDPKPFHAQTYSVVTQLWTCCSGESNAG